jgi:hypothetical protein
MNWIRLVLLALSLIVPVAATVARGSNDHGAMVVQLDEDCIWWVTTRSHFTCLLDEVGAVP